MEQEYDVMVQVGKLEKIYGTLMKREQKLKVNN